MQEKLHLDCSSALANFPKAFSDLLILENLPSGHQHQLLINIEFHCCPDFSCAETAIGTISVSTAYEPRIPATDKDAFWPCRCIVDTIDLSTNEIEDPISRIASQLRLWVPFTSLMRTSRTPPCVMFVAAAVVASEASGPLFFLRENDVQKFVVSSSKNESTKCFTFEIF